MNKIVLLLGHGSRSPQAQAEFIRLTDLVQQRLRPVKIQVAFLELCAPLISQGVRSCIESGAEKILAIPVFLNDATHVKKDLPDELNQARARYPLVPILYGRPLGMDPGVQEVLLERLWESVGPQELRSMALLLVGRGSPDPAATGELKRLGVSLRKQLRCHFMAVSFVDRASPTIPEGLEACRASGAQVIGVLPCLLFPGIVLDRVHRAAADFKSSYPGISLKIARYLGVHPKLADLVVKRIHECEQA